MLDISFSEIAVIGAVALVVLGPERLPKVARTAGHLFGRLQRYVNGVKADIAREMEGSELAKIKQEVQDAARSFEQTVQKHAGDVESEAKLIQTHTETLAANTSSPAISGAGVDADTSATEATSNSTLNPEFKSAFTATEAHASPKVGVDAAHSSANLTVFGQGLFDFGIEPLRHAAAQAPTTAARIAAAAA